MNYFLFKTTAPPGPIPPKARALGDGIGRYLLNVSVDQDVVYGLLTERTEKNDASETPSIVVYNNQLEEIDRISCENVKDYLINTYPNQFCVRKGNIYVQNGNNMEVLVALIENDALKEVFRRQGMNFTIPWARDEDPVLFSAEMTGVLYSLDTSSGIMKASKVFMSDDRLVPGFVWQAQGTLLILQWENNVGIAGYAVVDYEKLFPAT